MSFGARCRSWSNYWNKIRKETFKTVKEANGKHDDVLNAKLRDIAQAAMRRRNKIEKYHFHEDEAIEEILRENQQAIGSLGKLQMPTL